MAWLLGRVGDKGDVHVVADNNVSTLWDGVPVREVPHAIGESPLALRLYVGHRGPSRSSSQARGRLSPR